MAVRLRAVIAAASLGVAGCADERVHLDVHLATDPARNRVDQVMAQVETMRLVIDADTPLYLPGEEMDDGTVAVMDADGDPDDLELVARLPRYASRFPTVELRRGGLPDVRLDLRVEGYDEAGELAAEGTALSVALAKGGRVELPFNLLADRLPPRVSEVVALPPGGCSPPVLTVVFSRGIAPATVLAPGAVTFTPGGAPTRLTVDALGRLATITPPMAVVGSGRIHFTMTLAGITDADGEPLDQSFAVEGVQPYVGRFDDGCP